MSINRIPLVNFSAYYHKSHNNIIKILQNVISQAHFINSIEKATFEDNFARYIGVKYCVGVGNGTDALEIAIKALQMPEHSEIITHSNTFISTALGIVNNGLIPVFVDINEETLMIDVDKIEENINVNTKAICFAHLFGTSPNMNKLIEIAKKYNLYLIEDCCQSHGSRYNNIISGNFGDVGCFSFYPSKNLGCFGDGGTIITNNDNLYNNIKLLHNLGSKIKNNHEIIGRNSRLDSIQAAILDYKLLDLDTNNDLRRQHAELYYKLLSHNKYIKLLKIEDNVVPVWHLFIIRVLNNKRSELINYLNHLNIETGIHYPIPIHKQQAFKDYNHILLPNTELIATELLSLPMYPELLPHYIIFICDSINNFFF